MNEKCNLANDDNISCLECSSGDNFFVGGNVFASYYADGFLSN